MKSLGIDIGSSSVKVSLLDIESGKCLASSTNPSSEMPIKALKNGWAEQDPRMWWQYACDGIRKVGSGHGLSDVKCIGITYQMHGLVCMGKDGNPVRDAIIWCDSRAVEIGRRAMDEIGHEKCLEHLLNSPGNFTASKLAWVIRNEKETFDKVDKFFLPGDYIAWMLSGDIHTTETGLSEQILWDFKEEKRADFVADCYGIPADMIPETVPAIGIQAVTSHETEKLVTDTPEADRLSRVNTFVHVSHKHEAPRYGILLCINGTGIMNAWIRRNFCSGLGYDEINSLAATAPAGSEGVSVLPFGNGAERVLENRFTGASVSGLDLNRHTLAHVLRATQEGIAYSFRYGIDIMKGIGLKPNIIRAGKANLFLSPLFRQTLSTLTGADIELYDTDGALGAARGAALGAGLYRSREETFASLEKLETVTPDRKDKAALEDGFERWKNLVGKLL